MNHCYRIGQSTNKSKEHTLLKTMLMLFCLLTLTSSVNATEVFTDRADYPPGDSVVIIGIAFQSYETVTVQITHLDGNTPVLLEYDPWDVAADDFGDFESFWIVPDTALGETLLITATGQNSGLVATTTFTDASTILTFTSTFPSSLCPGSTFNVCATLYQKCNGGLLGELPGRQLDFYLNEGSCGVNVGQTPDATGYTDSNGEACVNITVPTTPGEYSITVFFTGEAKPGTGDLANGVCCPDQRVQLSNSKDCRGFLSDPSTCNAPPVCGVPADQTFNQCIPTQVSLPVSCSDPDGNLSSGFPMIVSGPGSLVGGNWVYTPSGDETAVVTIRCQDDFGAYCEATFSITFDINSAPVITCPADITINCDESSDPINTGSATATDDNGSPTITYSDVETGGACPQEKVITRTWTATDGCGSTNQCVQTITVVDTTDPVITCPADIAVECDGSTDPSSTGSATATDNCDATVTITYADVTAGNVITRTWTATDDCGNSATCDQLLTINDTIDPTITCPADITVECDGSIDPSATGSATATDNCDATVTIAYTDTETAGACADAKTITRTWVATDDASNSASCVQTITVVDTTDPVITCPADIAVECDGSTDPSATGSATATDNCDATVTITYADVTAGNVITRTWTATDDCGNSATCDQLLTINDTTDPVITCPADITVDCDGSTDPSATGSATATDNCDVSLTITYTDSEVGGACLQEKVITRIWTATDDASNSASCVQTITVVDTTDPVITCPADIAVECDGSTDPSSTGSATATDNCDASVAISYSDATAGNVITRTWTATDDCGNSATCDQLLTINDTTDPVITCPANLTIECDGSTDPSATGSATATDNCDVSLTITYTDSEVGGACPQEKVITRIWTATDDASNSASCVQTITVVDTTDPVITCPADIAVECDGSTDPSATGSATATDNCDATLTITYADVTVGNVITRTWTATDDCGNSATCDQLLTINDTTDPVISCPADIAVECDASTDPSSTGSATATDNCDVSVTITYSDSEAAGSCPQEKVITRTWTATDDDDNSSTCDQTITVEDTTDPVITCPADVTVECDGSTDPSATGSATATDNCDATLTITYADVTAGNVITRTWTATDDCGNSSACDQIISYANNSVPTATCPGNSELFVCDYSPLTISGFQCEDVDLNLVSCSVDNGSLAGGDVTFTPVAGANTITLTATDACGMTATCQTIVTVTLNSPPTVTYPTFFQAPEFYVCNLDPITITDDWVGSFYCSDPDGNLATCELNSGTVNGDGTITFTPVEGINDLVMTATDDCGLTVVGEVQVLVYFRTAPVPVCPGDQEIFVCDLSPITIDGFDCNVFNGTCEVDNGTLTDGSVTFTPVVGVNTITLTATNECGQVGTCQTNVTVNMNNAPTAICPGNLEMLVCDLSPITIPGFSCSDADGNLASCEVDNGNLSGDDVTFTPVAGVNTITLTATDNCGETATCAMTVTVTVNSPPNPLNCPADDEIFVCSLEEICLPGITWGDVDNNLLSIIPSVGTLSSGTLCFTPVEGVNTITITATDECGETAECTFNITVIVNSSPEAHCPGDMTLYLFELEEVCIPGFYCDDVDDNLAACDVNVGTLIGDELCFTPVEGDNQIIISATDECGAGSKGSCECIMNINVVLISNCPKLTISTELLVLQGHYKDVTVTIENATYEIGGFDLLMAYDASAISFMSAEPGEFLNDCEWEYFTYRTGAEGSCGSACPSGILRVFALAETNNGPGINPACYITPDAGLYDLFTMRFFITNDRTFECQFAPIQFYWGDCGDNSFSSANGDTLFVDRLIYDFTGSLIWDEDDDDQFPEDDRIPFIGAPDFCIDNPMPDKPTAIRCIDFQHGGINIICADEIDDRGDLNLNGISNEIADAVVFTNYFTHGLDAFVVNSEGQIAASDVNADGISLSVADLVYIIRVINGDVLLIDKIVAYGSTVGIGSRGSVIFAGAELGGGAFVFEGDVNVDLTDNSSHMQMKSNFDGENTRVVIYSFDKGAVFSGEILKTEGKLLTVEVSDYFGNLYKVGDLPQSFSLTSYPNPFNPSTTIEMMLPVASDWKVDIYNVSGQKAGAFGGTSEAGLIKVNWDATGQSSGIYFIKASAGSYKATKKAILLK